MFPSFLPSDASLLTEPTSIALAQKIERAAIATPLSPQPISTAYVHQGCVDPGIMQQGIVQPETEECPILLLHGFDSSVLEFRRLLPLLAAEAETWAIDMLGFGLTDRPPDVAISPSTINTHLYYLWKTLINRPVILVGASMGGAAAIAFTLSHPEAVQKLVLLDSAGFAKGPEVGKWLIPPLAYLAAEFLRLSSVRKQISLNAYVDPSFVSADALLCAALHLNQPGWHRAMVSFTRSGGYTSVADQIQQIEQPTLILWGDSDRILGTADGEKFQAAIAHSQLIWIEQCGHVPHLEKPQITAQNILSFTRQTT